MSLDWQAVYSILAIVILLDYVALVFDPKGQSWHDKLADTVVINKPG
jgi:uncharacterized RDD family membrane protein YckC